MPPAGDPTGAYAARNKFLQNVERLINRHGVDLWLSGHTHNYERVLPVYRGNVDRAAVSDGGHSISGAAHPMFVTAGGAGDEEAMFPPPGVGRPCDPSVMPCFIPVDQGFQPRPTSPSPPSASCHRR